MTDYKVGDKVRILVGYRRGQVDTIMKFPDNDDDSLILNTAMWYGKDEVEPYTPEEPKLEIGDELFFEAANVARSLQTLGWDKPADMILRLTKELETAVKARG